MRSISNGMEVQLFLKPCLIRQVRIPSGDGTRVTRAVGLTETGFEQHNDGGDTGNVFCCPCALRKMHSPICTNGKRPQDIRYAMVLPCHQPYAAKCDIAGPVPNVHMTPMSTMSQPALYSTFVTLTDPYCSLLYDKYSHMIYSLSR